LLSAGLARWRKPTAVHDPAKIILDLALSLAVGGDCLADIAVLRAEPSLFGRVASDPTVSRTIDALAADAPAVLAAVDAARAQASGSAFGRVRSLRSAGDGEGAESADTVGERPECGGWPVSRRPTTTATRTGRS
jgi:hypothetical protein